MLSIGEFSQSSRLTVKALRIYHDEGLLVPERIDPANGYRYYGDQSFKKARAIFLLRELGFSLAEMKDIFANARDDDDLALFFRRRLEAVDRELVRVRDIRERIRYFVENVEDESMGKNLEIRERDVSDIWMCGIRYQGAYADIGTRFSALFRKTGRYMSGKPFALYYDCEYRENADIEAAVPVRKEVSIDGIDCRKLPGGRFVSIVHRGAYEGIGEAYKALFDYLSAKSLVARAPVREIYLKGPGMIFPRDSAKFVTEILIPV